MIVSNDRWIIATVQTATAVLNPYALYIINRVMKFISDTNRDIWIYDGRKSPTVHAFIVHSIIVFLIFYKFLQVPTSS